jgi:hypothetical protein
VHDVWRVRLQDLPHMLRTTTQVHVQRLATREQDKLQQEKLQPFI